MREIARRPALAPLVALLAGFGLALVDACATPSLTRPTPGASAHPATAREELWILDAWRDDFGSETEARPPESGLFARRADGELEALSPVSSDVDVAVEGRLAALTRTQVFAPATLAGAAELELRLVLPAGASVDELVLGLGERRIRAVVQERERARELWALARSQGRPAVLVSEAAPGVFVQRLELDDAVQGISLRMGWAQPVSRLVLPGSSQLQVPLGSQAGGSTLDLAVDIDAGLPVQELVSTSLPGFTPSIDDAGRAIARWEGPAPSDEVRLAWRIARSSEDRAVLWSDGEALHLVLYPAKESRPLPVVQWEAFGARELPTDRSRVGYGHLARRQEARASALEIDLAGGSTLEVYPRPSRLHAAHRVLARAELEALERRAAALDPGVPAQRAELDALGRQALDLALANGLVSPLTELVLIDASAR